MNASTIAIILGAAITSGGVTYYLTNQPPLPQPTSTKEVKAKTPEKKASISTPSTSSTRSQKPTPPTKKIITKNRSNKKNTNKPDGISDEIWTKAQGRAERFAEWANRTRDSKRSRERLERRAERNSRAITSRLNLPEESSNAIQKVLTSRIEKSIEKANSAADIIINNTDALATLAATRELQNSDEGISDELLATRQSVKEELFSEFYDDGKIPDAIDIGNLITPNRPTTWYKDNEFIVNASAELGGSQAADLIEYASKLDYLDRQDNAFNRVNTIERSVDLKPQQSNDLKQLYIDNPSPTDQQISNIVGQQNLQAIKTAERNNRRR